MEISCASCNSSFVIPDDRVPETRKFKLNCPKCREPILVDRDTLDERIVQPEHFPHDAVVAFVFIRNRELAVFGQVGERQDISNLAMHGEWIGVCLESQMPGV